MRAILLRSWSVSIGTFGAARVLSRWLSAERPFVDLASQAMMWTTVAVLLWWLADAFDQIHGGR